MEKGRKNKKGVSKNVLLIIIIILVAALVVETAFLFKAKTSSGNSGIETINVVETPIVDFIVGFEEVSGLKASYNSEKPYNVTFLADMGDKKDIEILKFYFDEDKGNAIGIIKSNTGKKVKVSVEQMLIDESLGLKSDEIDMLSALQIDLIDTIVANFEIVEYADNGSNFDEGYSFTKTPYGRLPFDKEYEDYLVVDKIEGEPYKVVFSCQFEKGEPVELFTYSFGKDAKDVIGSIKDSPVGLTVGTAEANKKWNQKEQDIFYMMREEMNYIIDYLIDAEGLVIK